MAVLNIILISVGFTVVFSTFTFLIVMKNLRKMHFLYGQEGVALGLKNWKRNCRDVFWIVGIGGFLPLAYIACTNDNFIFDTKYRQDTLIAWLCGMLMVTSGLLGQAAGWTVWDHDAGER